MTQPSIPSHHATAERGLLFRVALATAIAVIIIAVASTLVGTQLSTITARSGIERRASLLSVMIAARMREVPVSQWGFLADRMTSRIGGIVSVVGARGVPIESSPPSPVSMRDPLPDPKRAATPAAVAKPDFRGSP